MEDINESVTLPSYVIAHYSNSPTAPYSAQVLPHYDERNYQFLGSDENTALVVKHPHADRWTILRIGQGKIWEKVNGVFTEVTTNQWSQKAHIYSFTPGSSEMLPDFFQADPTQIKKCSALSSATMRDTRPRIPSCNKPAIEKTDDIKPQTQPSQPESFITVQKILVTALIIAGGLYITPKVVHEIKNKRAQKVAE